MWPSPAPAALAPGKAGDDPAGGPEFWGVATSGTGTLRLHAQPSTQPSRRTWPAWRRAGCGATWAAAAPKAGTGAVSPPRTRAWKAGRLPHSSPKPPHRAARMPLCRAPPSMPRARSPAPRGRCSRNPVRLRRSPPGWRHRVCRAEPARRHDPRAAVPERNGGVRGSGSRRSGTCARHCAQGRQPHRDPWRPALCHAGCGDLRGVTGPPSAALRTS